MSDPLLEAVASARPGLPEGELSPDGEQARAVLERALSLRRRSWSRRVMRTAPVAVAVGATALVAAIAIITLRGRAPATSRAGAGATSLDAGLQRAGQRALRHAIEANPQASGGAFVALDPDSGTVYAIGSLPTSGRAIESAGPTGSTLTPITALAALESGVWAVGEEFDDSGQFCLDGQCRHNAGTAVDGVLDVENALKVSSNDFFYNLGALTNSAQPQGGVLQHWARELGIGMATGVDLPSENPGTLPTPAWRARRNRLEAECDAGRGPFAGKPKRPIGSCGFADGTNRPWSFGDNLSLAIGQGDVQVTPLQLAVAYAAIANGGTVLRPRLHRATGPRPARKLVLDRRDLDAVRAGLLAAASQPGGTSADVFKGFPKPVYGETGSAQYTNQQDDAWFAGFVPATATSRPIVVVVRVDQGGFGAQAAAPVARQILSQWFLGRPGPWVPGAAKTL
jgi:penicillin-binding protein 2